MIFLDDWPSLFADPPVNLGQGEVRVNRIGAISATIQATFGLFLPNPFGIHLIPA